MERFLFKLIHNFSAITYSRKNRTDLGRRKLFFFGRTKTLITASKNQKLALHFYPTSWRLRLGVDPNSSSLIGS